MLGSNPRKGYVSMLRQMMPLPASIHTFGFGYSLNSGLLKSIAEVAGGSYAFIPDTGMVGTVFVHAVANLQATCATDAVLTLDFPSHVQLESAMGESLDQAPTRGYSYQQETRTQLKMTLGNVIYGQSRNLMLRVKNMDLLRKHEKSGFYDPPIVQARLSFRPALVDNSPETETTARPRTRFARNMLMQSMSSVPALPLETISQSCHILEESSLPTEFIAYHESRAQICSFLSYIFPINSQSQRHSRHRKQLTRIEQDLATLVATIPARDHDDALNRSLMEDLTGLEPQGQVSLAVESDEYYVKWGAHYLPSYLDAHTRQMCNTFKDPGPLQYGVHSPLFIKCRDRLDDAFDRLPPPKPTLAARGNYAARNSHSHGHGQGHTFSMSVYNSAGGPCFAASTPVQLASGRSVAISALRRGIKVSTPAGARRVAMVLRTPVKEALMCRLGEDLLVTPWHPVCTEPRAKTWAFPAAVSTNPPVRYTGSVYSVLLERDGTLPMAHAIQVAGVWGVTLGHGIVAGGDVRAHAFLGDYDRVGRSLVKLGVNRKGVALSGGVERAQDGLICGFKPRRRRVKAVSSVAGDGSAKTDL
jgi:hypothetical protein